MSLIGGKLASPQMGAQSEPGLSRVMSGTSLSAPGSEGKSKRTGSVSSFGTRALPEEGEEVQSGGEFGKVLVCGHCRNAHGNEMHGFCHTGCFRAWREKQHSKWMALGRRGRLVGADGARRLPDWWYCINYATKPGGQPVHIAELIPIVEPLVVEMQAAYDAAAASLLVPSTRPFEHLPKRGGTLGQPLSVQAACGSAPGLGALYAAGRRWMGWASGVVRSAAIQTNAEILGDPPLKPTPAAILKCERSAHGAPNGLDSRARVPGSLTDVVRYSLVTTCDMMDELVASLRGESQKAGGRVCTVRMRWDPASRPPSNYRDMLVLLEGPVPQRLICEVQIHSRELWRLYGNTGRSLSLWANVLNKWKEHARLHGGLWIGPRSGCFPNAYGTLHTPAGGVLRGEWLAGQLESGEDGTCTVLYPNKDLYLGEMARGYPHGTGRYLYVESGAEYYGGWHLGTKHGQGRLRFKDGATYEGQYEDGMEQGAGLYRHANGEEYEGEYVAGLRHGKGHVRFSDKSAATSEWERGKQQGPCTYYFPSGTIDLLRMSTQRVAGAGVRCSDDRFFLLSKGNLVREISTKEASGIARKIGLRLPGEKNLNLEDDEVKVPTTDKKPKPIDEVFQEAMDTYGITGAGAKSGKSSTGQSGPAVDS
eukprot:Hpha_TRINITY_DN5197_c0_g1::TRINITY_DN5197_c0_g1_i1::g.193084::m.193084